MFDFNTIIPSILKLFDDDHNSPPKQEVVGEGAQFDYYLYPSGDSVFDVGNYISQPIAGFSLHEQVHEGLYLSDDSRYIQASFTTNPSGSFSSQALPSQSNFYPTGCEFRVRFANANSWPATINVALKDANGIIIGTEDIGSIAPTVFRNGIATTEVIEANRSLWDLSKTEILYSVTCSDNQIHSLSAIDVVVAGTGTMGHWSHLCPLSVGGGHVEINENIPLFASGGVTHNNISLFTTNFETSNSSINLVISGTPIPDSGTIPLHTISIGSETNTTTLFISGVPTPTSGNIPLYMNNFVELNDNTTLFIDGIPFPYSGDTTLFTHGHDEIDKHLVLFLNAAGLENDNMNLYVGGTDFSTPTNLSVPFYTKGLASGLGGGLFSTMTTYVKGADQNASGMMNLYLDVQSTNDATDDTSDMNLFLRAIGNVDGSQNHSNEITMVISNEWVAANDNTPLTIWNQQGSMSSGYIPISGNMNLYINRPFNSVAHNFPMYVAGPSGTDDTTTLFMQGFPNQRSGVDMFTEGIGQKNKTTHFYSHGN